MDRVFIYWDTSNIFHEAQRLAEELARSWRRLDQGSSLRLRVMRASWIFPAGASPEIRSRTRSARSTSGGVRMR